MKLKKSKPLSILVAALMLAAMLIISVATARPKQKPAAADTAATVSQASDSTPDETRDDMRGIWVTYMELSMEYESDQSEAAFRRKFEAIAEDCKVSGFNTLIVQVRPFCDALYQSKLFPASHVLSGEQGKSLGYDPLRIMCAICQKRGLRLHAWVNPYRVTVNQTPAQLSDNNPYVKDPSLGIETESGIILDPSNERARQLIVDGVREIAENYAVDGIQFDDYFYPTDIENLDHAQYQAYAATVKEGEPMDLAQWRRENVNLLLAQVYLAVHRAKENVVFGVSPQGNLQNNEVLYADVVRWCEKQGYVDYICPQIYFSPDNPAMGFETALDEWQALNIADSVRLYVGLAGYKAGSDEDAGTWLGKDDVLATELNILRKKNKVKGFLLYGYASLRAEQAQAEMQHFLAAVGQSG